MAETTKRDDVLVALSGGLDSAASVLLLRENGYHPAAVYFDNLGDQAQVAKVTRLAQSLGVELHIVDARDLFSHSVVNYLKTELIAGRTPAPCAFCNTHLKWRLLVETADRLGVKLIATGHYAQIARIPARGLAVAGESGRELAVAGESACELAVAGVSEGGVPVFKRGADPVKDQTYYLWNVAPEILERTILPLGAMTKTEVRNYLKTNGFEELGGGPESMSLCFLPRGVSYTDFVKNLVLTSPGDILNTQGTRVGRHDGYPLYTIGQQRGLDIAELEARKYAVVRISPERNELIVSVEPTDLYTKTLTVRDYIAHSEALYGDGVTVLVRGLGRNPAGFGRVVREGARLRVELENPAWAVAAGQPVVFYKGDFLLGGGYAE